MQRFTSSYVPFRDKKQNFWQLASIQSAALGLPVILVGGDIASKLGPGVAIGSILIGNLILWLIALATIEMTDYGANAIENVGSYLGKWGKLLFAITIGMAFLGWYTMQSKAGASITSFLLILEKNQQIRIGAIIGILTALLSMGGIQFIKWLNVICLPLIFIFFNYIIIKNGISFHNFRIGVSFSGVLSVVSILLPGIINLPTFFRHSRSKSHSFLALAIMTFIVSIFQCFSVILRISNINDMILLNVNPVFIISFSVISLLCINIVNIYLASGVLETILQRAADAKDYAILGLAGTGAFALLQALSVMNFLENTTNGFIASVGAVLIGAFLIKIIVSHRARPFEKIINNGCWLIGCFSSLIILTQNPQQANRALLYGFGTSALSLLIVIFIEETIWAFNNSSI